MVSNKTATRKTSDKRRRAKATLKLSKKARAEVAKLLKHHGAGTITQVELETGLEEVKERLNRILNHIRSFL
jgi:hypothetical protein